MTSPFPGMDPYLEGHLWPDVHHSLAFVIKELLVPQLPAAYLVQTEVYHVRDTSAEKDVGILYPVEVVYPDVAVTQRKVEEPAGTYRRDPPPWTPATVTLSQAHPIELRIPVVEIRDRDHNQLVTAIEILSPVNKRTPGLEPYRIKRSTLHQSGVHLLEIDLLRRGERSIQHPALPRVHYLVSLARAMTFITDVWAINLPDPLPVVPVPLRHPDPDLVLDLREALRLIYQRSQYQRAIDYTQPPPPPALSEADTTWLRQQIESPQAGNISS